MPHTRSSGRPTAIARILGTPTAPRRIDDRAATTRVRHRRIRPRLPDGRPRVPESQIHVYRVPHGERQRRLLASIPARGPGYIHDCSFTTDHVVLVEPPLDIVPRRALAPWTEGVFDLLEWIPDRGTRIVVLDRDSGDLLRDATIEPVFVFHHVNAYAEDGTVVLDVRARALLPHAEPFGFHGRFFRDT